MPGIAAANIGNSRASTRAREAAYTEDIQDLQENLLPELPDTSSKQNGQKFSFSEKDTESKSDSLIEKADFGKLLYDFSAPNPDEALEDIAKSGKMTAFGDASIQSNTQKSNTNKNHDFGNIYSGNIWGNEPREDLYYSDLNKEQLRSLKGVTQADLILGNDYHEFLLKSLGNLTSVADKEMNAVVDDMIEHFFDGTGTDYSNSTLTEKVKNHNETQRYMNDFCKVFQEQLQQNGGDITKLKQTDDFRNALEESGVLLSKYDYYDTNDKINGLTMAVHSWTESDVDVKSFSISEDGSYSGTLTFTFKDNFGLDKYDVEKFGKIPGFSSWFTLQHDYRNSGKYKPFKTVVKIDYPISGKIEGYNNE